MKPATVRGVATSGSMLVIQGIGAAFATGLTTRETTSGKWLELAAIVLGGAIHYLAVPGSIAGDAERFPDPPAAPTKI